ncbi:MAG: methyltransferase domain-containing protein, partial [Polyangiaceae bacterium]|nr:methyltransferase domain-containing protein [Polyangiaceae bacterium]
RRRRPLSMREDFCGTALLCARWVESHPERTATGVDLDPKVLAWGTEHHLAPLGQAARRVRLLEQDVRAPTASRFDIVNALNFSYWVFKTRAQMLHYFRAVRASLNKDGLFVVDSYGGWEALEPMTERRRIRGGFTYIWDQSRIDPISHDVTNHIHFEFTDGSRIEKAFTYEWRFWTLPELTELLTAAGYSEVRVYWDDSEDDEQTSYRPRRHAENQPGWLAYLVGVR